MLIIVVKSTLIFIFVIKLKTLKRKHYYLILRMASQIINRQQLHLVTYRHFIIQQRLFQLNHQWKRPYK